MAEEKFNPYHQFIAGGVGGVLCVFVGHPFDTCKVRLQTMKSSNQPEYTGTFNCMKKIIQKENIFGLYKGMGAPLVTIAPLNAINFLGYGAGTKLFSNEINVPNLKPWQYFVAGCIGGFSTVVLATPGERIKCLLQIQHGGQSQLYLGPVDVVQKLTKQYGIRSLFKGFGITLIRDVIGFGAYYASYEMVKQVFLRMESPTKNVSHQGDSEPTLPEKQKKGVSLYGAIVAGSCAGFMYWAVALPADILKTRVQTAPEGKYPRGARSVLVEILGADGYRGLYRGASPVLMRSVPANAACFLGIELAMRILGQ